MHPGEIDRMVRKYAAEIGLARGYSAHSMRATFITTALEKRPEAGGVQKAAGHRDPSRPSFTTGAATIRRKRPAFFATYCGDSLGNYSDRNRRFCL
jgi:integrase/recombinase XerD